MSLRITCPCNARLGVPGDPAGRAIRCPTCGRRLTFAALDPVTEPPGTTTNMPCATPAPPKPRAGTFAIKARFVQGPASGIVSLAVNGRPARQRLDLFAPQAGTFPVADLGEFELPKGEMRFRVEVVGTNPSAQKPGYEFGIVSLVLRRTDARD